MGATKVSLNWKPSKAITKEEILANKDYYTARLYKSLGKWSLEVKEHEIKLINAMDGCLNALLEQNKK